MPIWWKFGNPGFIEVSRWPFGKNAREHTSDVDQTEVDADPNRVTNPNLNLVATKGSVHLSRIPWPDTQSKLFDWPKLALRNDTHVIWISKTHSLEWTVQWVRRQISHECGHDMPNNLRPMAAISVTVDKVTPSLIFQPEHMVKLGTGAVVTPPHSSCSLQIGPSAAARIMCLLAFHSSLTSNPVQSHGQTYQHLI